LARPSREEFRELEVDPHCPFCDGTAWEEPPDDFLWLTMAKTGETLRADVLICNHCGFLRMHAKDRLQE
jgi:hypothetical protein